MKKLVLLMMITTVLNLSMVKSQTNQGKILVGVSSSLSMAGTGSNLMSLGFSTEKTKSDAAGYKESDPDKTFSINLLPKVGYFFANNLALGLDITLAYTKSENNGTNYNDTYSTRIFSAGPFARYYIPTGKVLPFFEIGGTFGGVKSKYTYSYPSSSNTEHKSSIIGINGGIGLAAPLSEKVTFDVMVDYNTFTIKAKDDNPDNERGIVGTLGLKFGFVVFLGGN